MRKRNEIKGSKWLPLPALILVQTILLFSAFTSSYGQIDRIEFLLSRWKAGPPERLCFERAALMTDSYEKTEGEPEPVRRAKALSNVLTKMSVVIAPMELICGNIASEASVPWFDQETFNWSDYSPEREYILKDWVFSDSLSLRYRIPIDIAEFWRNRPQADRIGHYVPDYRRVLKKGFAGIMDDINRYRIIRKEKGTLSAETATWYNAAEIVCRATRVFAQRYADAAVKLADSKTDPVRKKELKTIADICTKVPWKPAETFQEALQSFWFTHIFLHLSSPEGAISPGRFDQYMWPYYKADLEDGRLTREKAEELLACLWIKFNEVRVNSVDFINYQNLMVGGTDAEGRDASNDLSKLCIEVTHRVPMTQPSLSLRWHPNLPHDLLERAAELILSGSGRPALFNDMVMIPALEAAGVSRKDARNYAIFGCEEPTVPGLMYVGKGGQMNQPQCLLNAMARFPKDGPADFNALLGTYRTELKKSSIFKIKPADGKHVSTVHSFVELLFDDCLERAKGLTNGGVCYFITCNAEAGTITAANALYAIKQAVFEEKRIAFDELYKALNQNFAGYEDLRAYLWYRVPKFGNDIPGIDMFASQIAHWNHAVLAEYQSGPQRYFTGSGNSRAFLQGTHTGATPDGRYQYDSFSVGLGPSAGTDENGPTALLNSVTKINWTEQVGGGLTHLQLPFTYMQDQTSASTLLALVEAFFRNGGMGLHATVVDAAMLRAALKEPEKHTNLIVRVGGYSAPFVLLSKDLQKNILERFEHQIY